jgi:hypothetical protein
MQTKSRLSLAAFSTPDHRGFDKIGAGILNNSARRLSADDATKQTKRAGIRQRMMEANLSRAR